jgi:hypothetical protein
MQARFLGWTATLLLVATVATGACRGRDRNASPWVRPSDDVLRDVQRTGQLSSKALREASGMVQSARDTGLFWALNDSGNEPRLFALEISGRVLGSVKVRGVRNRDWEALGLGPCPEGTCLYVGDVGDNGARRRSVMLHRLLEPVGPNDDVRPIQSLEVRYADGPHDVEAMYVGPDTSVWLVTKRPARSNGGERPARVYRVPPDAWRTAAAAAAAGDSAPVPYTAAVVDSVPVTPRRRASDDWITDASLSPRLPDGTRRLVLLSYGAVHVLDADAGTGRPGALVARCALPIPERNAEAIAWMADGRLLVANEGKGAPLYAGRCP